MNCGRCGHGLFFHGRRGHGACRLTELTEEGKRVVADILSVNKQPLIAMKIAEIICALPGTSKRCDCKRFRRTPQQPDNGKDGER